MAGLSDSARDAAFGISGSSNSPISHICVVTRNAGTLCLVPDAEVMSASLNSHLLEAKLRSRKARVAIIGLGYAGLPMAIELGRAGYEVIGYDVDHGRVEQVQHDLSPVSTVPDEQVATLRAAQRLSATIDPTVLGTADVVLIAVPTPLSPDGRPDLRFVESAGATLARHLRPGMLVMLQSTCGPGTTTRQLGPLLTRESRLIAGEDFFLGFAPERIDPGNNRYTVRNTPKLIGGITPESTRLGCVLFAGIVEDVIPVSSPEVAEMAKLVENTFRFINISFVNEMALLCDQLGVNVWEVIEAAKTKPFAFMAHYPGPGVGGHCIPVVPQYLEAAAAEHGLGSELIHAANRINNRMPLLVVDKIEQALEAEGNHLIGARVLGVGVTYKPDVADVRESAAVRVLEEAIRRGARVTYYDPLIPLLRVAGESLESVTLEQSGLARADAVVLLTPHSSIDYDAIVRGARLVVDTHPALRPRVGANVHNVWVPAPTLAPVTA